MRSSLNFSILTLVLILLTTSLFADSKNKEDEIDKLQKPLYNPFVERYVLDELKQLRIDMAAQKHEIMQQILDREHRSVDRGVRYATDTVTYFFYLIAGATSILVLVGWTSIRDIKERMHNLANTEIKRLIEEYEGRLAKLETQLKQKTQHIEENREEIELTQEKQSLWLRAQQESSPAGKISYYDQLLKLDPEDSEALTYKADAVLDLEQPQWAASLCHQALDINPDNAHAYYQLACVNTVMNKFDEALSYLQEAVSRNETYIASIDEEPMLKPLMTHEKYSSLIPKN